MTVTPPAPPILGVYQTNGAFPTPGPSAWPSGATTNLAAQYMAWGQDWPTYGAAFINQCNTNSLVPFVELEPWNAGANWNTVVPFTDITSGVWDAWLTQIGTFIASTAKPVILTFGHEMNVSGQYPWSQGDTGSGPGGGALTAAEWIAGWKYVHDKINSTAGGYALWMWACSAWTGGTTVDPSPWWPGASYVDMVGIDGYPNTQYGASLGTFAGQIQPTVTAIRNLGWTQPIFLSETNLAQMVASGGESITSFVADMHTAGISGILEFEDAGWGLPQMTPAQWNEYNNAISTYYGASGGGGGGGTTSAMGTLADAFTGTALNTSLWQDVNANTRVQGGAVVMPCSTAYSLLQSTQAYNLTGSYAFAHINPDQGGASFESCLMLCNPAATAGYSFGYVGGNLVARPRANSAWGSPFGSLPYDAVQHAWLRIREQSGTIYYDTSPDSQTWTNRFTSTESTLAVTSLYARVFAGINATSGTAGTTYLYDFNTTVGSSGGGSGPGVDLASLWYDSTVIAGLNAQAALLNGGSIKVYSGSQPSVNGSLAGTLLVTLTFGNPAFATATASGGTATANANAITSGTAVATGTAGYFALVTSGGSTVLTGTVGVAGSGEDLIISATAITTGTSVSCTAFSLTQSETGS